MAGILISFDGLDSSGKATQAGVLFSHVEHRGALVKRFESPDYTTPSGKELKLRLQGKLGNWAHTPWQEKMGFFAQNRTEHKQEVIDILNQNGIVIYDRYVPSSVAFMIEESKVMGDDRAVVRRAVHELEYDINGMPRENMSLFFDIPPRLAIELLEGRKARVGDEDEFTDHISVQEALYTEYLNMIKEYPETMMRVICTDPAYAKGPAYRQAGSAGKLRSIDDISREVRSRLAQTFPEHVQFFA